MSKKKGGKSEPPETVDETIPDEGSVASEPVDEAGTGNDADFSVETDTQPEPEPEPSSHAPVQAKRGGSAVSGLAFILAVAALGASAYLWMQQQRILDQQAQPVDTGIDAQLAAIASEARQRDQQLSQITRSIESQRTQIGNQLKQIDRSQGEVRNRLGAYDQALASMQGISSESRETWILSEVEYLLEIAGRRVALLGDVDTALVAMTQADQRLATLDDQRLTSVRAGLSREIQALRATSRPDITGISLKLGSLAAASADFSLRGDHPDAPEPQSDEQPAGVDRAMSLVGDALGSLVRIQRTDESITPLLAPKEQYFLYQNLELMLLTARIALLKGDEISYRESLRSARSWLETYFDTAASDVRAAISDLVELESSDIKPNVPQIGAALQQLRAVRSTPDAVVVPALDENPDPVVSDPVIPDRAVPDLAVPDPATPESESQDNVEPDQ